MSDKRKRLLESALTLFVSQGFQGTPTSQVARHAGVATGTLFHHFENKLTLIRGVYEDCRARRDDGILSNSENLSVEQRFKNLFKSRIAWSLSNDEASTFIDRFENSEFADSGAMQNQELNDLIVEGQLSRKLRSVDEMILRNSVEALLGSFVLFYMNNPEKRKDEHHMYGAFNFFWTAIKY